MMTDLPKEYLKLNNSLENHMGSILNKKTIPLYDMMSYHMNFQNDQPRILGLLCLFTHLALEGKYEAALNFASSIEFVNNFIEIHDDVQSGQPQRNKRDTLWWKWGPAQAINAGDGMHALARLSILNIKNNPNINQTKTFEALKLLDNATIKTCESRYSELEYQERIDITYPEYIDNILNKGSALFECALSLGAVISNNLHSLENTIQELARNISLSIKMKKDISQIWTDSSSEDQNYALNKTKLIPVIIALENESVSYKRMIGEIYFKRVLEKEDLNNLRKILDELNIKKRSYNILNKSSENAIKIIENESIIQPQNKSLLLDLIKWIVN